MTEKRRKERERKTRMSMWTMQAAVAVWVTVAMCVMASTGDVDGDVDGITLVPTPFGWRPKQCVHRWPSGTAIRDVVGENRTHITLPDGKELSLPRLPECMKEYVGPDGLTHSRIQDGWLDNTGYYTNRLGDSYAFPSTHSSR